MLYRLSYSLGSYPTDGPEPGNSPAEPFGMQRILFWTLFVGLATAGDAAVRAQTTTSVDEKATPRHVVVAQADDGTVLLHGSTATIRGTMLRWEPEEKKRTLGFWTKADDAAEWTFTVRTAGTFDVEVLQGCGTGQGGSEMVVSLDPDNGDDAATIPFVVEDTGGFQEFRLRTVGRVTIATDGEHVLRVKPKKIAKAAACDIRQIRLVPADLP
ncbi:MAG: hypothetical protein KJS77_06175 [Planctomycetes bacterium]|nr:hypothetical protein [Planctomycetota bacterium]